jgi:hypothetical protein
MLTDVVQLADVAKFDNACGFIGIILNVDNSLALLTETCFQTGQ